MGLINHLARYFRNSKEETLSNLLLKLPLFVRKVIIWWLEIYEYRKLYRAVLTNNDANCNSAVSKLLQKFDHGYVFRPATVVSTNEPVDIIICVHNALDDVKNCLRSVQQYTRQVYRLILVDDGSETITQNFLQGFAKRHGALLLRSDEATGYTFAANRGMREVKTKYFVLLNSDTEVTEGWLENMISACEANPSIGVVGPLSNTASWQSVPEVEVDGDWAPNPLPDGFMPNDIAQILAKITDPHPIAFGFLNGFCLVVRSQVIEEIGIFDEENFDVGYGEENDFCIRVAEAGWKLAVVEKSYVYHHQSRSYGDERRKRLAKLAGSSLIYKHQSKSKINFYRNKSRFNLRLIALRARLMALNIFPINNYRKFKRDYE